MPLASPQGLRVVAGLNLLETFGILFIHFSLLMTEHVLLYVVIGVIGLLSVFSFVVGVEKMIKIILGNYVLSSICLAASQSIDIFVNFLNSSPDMKLGGMTYKSLGIFFANGKTTIVLIIYVILLVVVYKNSKIHVSLPSDPALSKGLYVLLVPMTVLSMILTLQIAIMGINVINVQQLQVVATELTKNPGLYAFITMTPVWILIHGLATVLITSELKVGLKTGI